MADIKVLELEVEYSLSNGSFISVMLSDNEVRADIYDEFRVIQAIKFFPLSVNYRKIADTMLSSFSESVAIIDKVEAVVLQVNKDFRVPIICKPSERGSDLFIGEELTRATTVDFDNNEQLIAECKNWALEIYNKER